MGVSPENLTETRQKPNSSPPLIRLPVPFHLPQIAPSSVSPFPHLNPPVAAAPLLLHACSPTFCFAWASSPPLQQQQPVIREMRLPHCASGDTPTSSHDNWLIRCHRGKGRAIAELIRPSHKAVSAPTSGGRGEGFKERKMR